MNFAMTGTDFLGRIKQVGTDTARTPVGWPTIIKNSTCERAGSALKSLIRPAFSVNAIWVALGGSRCDDRCAVGNRFCVASLRRWRGLPDG